MIAAMRDAAGESVEEAVGPEPAQPQLSQWELPSWEEIVRAHSARVYRLAYRLPVISMTRKTSRRKFSSACSVPCPVIRRER